MKKKVKKSSRAAKKSNKRTLCDASAALAGRDTPMQGLAQKHFKLKTYLQGPWPAGHETCSFGMGCFWGAERVFWKVKGVYSTAVGYQGGFTPNPTYNEVRTGKTAHNEVVQVVFDSNRVPFAKLLKKLWESHNPTKFMR